MIMEQQAKKGFFDPTSDRSFPLLPLRPSDDEIRAFLESPECPLNRIVVSDKNRDAMEMLRLMAFTSLSRSDHSMRGMNFGLYAMPGQGKTTIVKALLDTTKIPHLFVQSDSLESTWHLFELMRDTCAQADIPLVPQSHQRHLVMPPLAVFFDEAHALSKDLRTGGLLNAMEANDGWLRTKPPGKNKPTFEIDCAQVCWIGATTDPGLLFQQSQAFFTRLTTTIRWANAGKKEITNIIHDSFGIPMQACELVAHYSRIPRTAKAFAEQTIWQRRMSGDTWENSARTIARLLKIDEHGMPLQFVDVLKALGQKPIAKANLCIPARCEVEELNAMVLPYLLDDFVGTGPLIGITSKGCALTKAGLKELDKRNIPHNGDGVLAEFL